MSENESTGDDGGVEVGSKNKRMCTLSEYYEKTKVTKRMKELEDVVSQQENILELVCEASRFVKDHGKVVDLSYYDRKKANALEVGLEQKKVSVLMDLVEAEYERDRYATMVTFSKINSVLDLGVEGLD